MLMQTAMITIGFLFIAPAVLCEEDCRYTPAKGIIRRASAMHNSATEQLTAIRTALESETKADWFVMIVKNPELMSDEVVSQSSVPWTIDGNDAVCVTVINGWQYITMMINDKERQARRFRRHALPDNEPQDVNLIGAKKR